MLPAISPKMKVKNTNAASDKINDHTRLMCAIARSTGNINSAVMANDMKKFVRDKTKDTIGGKCPGFMVFISCDNRSMSWTNNAI